MRLILLATSCVLFYLRLRACVYTCGFVCFILLVASCGSFYLRLRGFILRAVSCFYSTRSYLRLRVCVSFYLQPRGAYFVLHALGFVVLFYLRLRVSRSTCGFVVLFYLRFRVSHSSYLRLCDFILLAASCVLTVVNGSAGMDLTSRLWCDRSCWYCFVASTTYYFLLRSQVCYFVVWVRCC